MGLVIRCPECGRDDEISHRLLCRECDADELARHAERDSGRLILPEELPTASGDDRQSARLTSTDDSTPTSGGR
jgi:hypothetical protein